MSEAVGPAWPARAAAGGALTTRTSLSEGSATSSVTRKISMTQDRYLGRRLTDRQAADVLEDMFTEDTKTVPKTYSDLEDEPAASP
ncbi:MULTISPECIES: hypothetical protein [Pseudonocardia]|uniref:Uncharacterized protein n=1 Tax=Pseudonocardia alni TaxID=33907 RepID=A0A852W1V9_PSEA5|nr:MULTISPECIES: hypothetical protein [Pseudonocardia]MCO7192912.1 hypothetical protein [Pseudonocardia sp. McavD-2-B]NYG02360.1 hypothetical protein [Pseudonocardia antarctica]